MKDNRSATATSAAICNIRWSARRAARSSRTVTPLRPWMRRRGASGRPPCTCCHHDRWRSAASCFGRRRQLGCGGMRLLDRYLLRELLIPLGYCLCGFLLFWISSDMFVTLGDFQKKELLARDIVEYYVVMLPEFLVLVLPIALLLALLYALTNHARHQEITAIRAAGVSLWRISLPYLGVGFLASLVLFVVNEVWGPSSDE